MSYSSSKQTSFTKDCLKQAFLELLSEIPFPKISIIDIVNKAGVSRTAFYRNYETKDALLRDVIEQFLPFFHPEEDLDIVLADPYTFFLDLFQRMLAKRKELLLITKASIRNIPVNDGSEYTSRNLITFNIESSYEMNAAYGVLNCAIYKWTIQGFKETPEEMASMLTKMTLPYVQAEYNRLHKD